MKRESSVFRKGRAAILYTLKFSCTLLLMTLMSLILSYPCSFGKRGSAVDKETKLLLGVAGAIGGAAGSVWWCTFQQKDIR